MFLLGGDMKWLKKGNISKIKVTHKVLKNLKRSRKQSRQNDFGRCQYTNTDQLFKTDFAVSVDYRSKRLSDFMFENYINEVK